MRRRGQHRRPQRFPARRIPVEAGLAHPKHLRDLPELVRIPLQDSHRSVQIPPSRFCQRLQGPVQPELHPCRQPPGTRAHAVPPRYRDDREAYVREILPALPRLYRCRADRVCIPAAEEANRLACTALPAEVDALADLAQLVLDHDGAADADRLGVEARHVRCDLDADVAAEGVGEKMHAQITIEGQHGKGDG